jgi:hypothetical protein
LSRHRLRLLVALACSPALFAVPAMGITEKVPYSVKSSSSPSHAAVQGFIDKEVANLVSEDVTTQKLARETLAWDVAAHTGASATPQYQTEYANDLGKALASVLKSPSLRNRINASVVATEVAAQIARTDGASSSGLTPAVQAMLSDPQPAVVLWGIKAAKYVMASDIQGAADPSPIAKLIVKAVKEHGDSGPIIEEAFDSLTFDHLDKLKGDAQFVARTSSIIPDLLDLIAWRGEQYKAGTSTPSPLADRVATVFLPVTAFSAVNANQATRTRALKVMGDATCSILRAIANGSSTPEVIDAARADGRAFDSFGQQLPSNDLHLAGKAIAEMSQNSDPTRIGKLCDDLTNALKGVGVDLASDNGPGAAQAPPAPAVAGK